MSGSTTSATTSPALSITTLRPQEPLSADSQRTACVAESIIPAVTRQITLQITPRPWKSMSLLQVVENMEALQALKKSSKTTNACNQIQKEFNKGGERLETLIPEMESYIHDNCPFDYNFLITGEITISNAKRILRALPKVSWVLYTCPRHYVTRNKPIVLDVIHIFIDNGLINLQNEDGETILIKTVQTEAQTTGSVERHDNLVKMLLNAHADPNIQNANGRTALIEAAARGNDIAVQSLIEARANVDHQDRVGCFVRELSPFEKVLLKASEKPDKQVKKGATALMAAAFNDHHTVVKRLINAGADLYLRSEESHTAKMCTFKNLSLTSFQILKKAEENERRWKIISFALIFLRANRNNTLQFSFSTLIPQILEYEEGSKMLTDKLYDNLIFEFCTSPITHHIDRLVNPTLEDGLSILKDLLDVQNKEVCCFINSPPPSLYKIEGYPIEKYAEAAMKAAIFCNKFNTHF